MWNRDIIRVNFRRSSLHLENTLVAADAVRIDLVKFSRETGVLPPALEGKDVDARHQGMARGMTLRAVNLGVQVRLLPKRRLPLLMMTGDAEFLFGCGVGGQGDGGIHTQYDQNAP